MRIWTLNLNVDYDIQLKSNYFFCKSTKTISLLSTYEHKKNEVLLGNVLRLKEEYMSDVASGNMNTILPETE